jgi:hypothetical protein
MARHLALLIALAALARPSAAGAAPELWVADESSELGRVDVPTGAYTHVGRTMDGPTFVVLGDIALSPAGVLFGVADPAYTGGSSPLYRIDQATGALTLVGDTGVALEALGFRSDGALYGAGGTTVYALDPATGAATMVRTISPPTLHAGDLAFDASGMLYLTAHPLTGTLESILFRIDLAGAGFATVGPTGFKLVYGLALAADGQMYGTGYGADNVFRLDLATGAGTQVSVLPNTTPPSGIQGATAALGGGPSTTTTTTLPGGERCDNCVDDDGDGLVDFEEPSCCGVTGTIKLRHANLRLRGASGLLNLETQLSGLTGVDPLAQDLHVILRHQNGTLIFCGRMPATSFKKRLKFFNFRDRRNTIASAAGVDGVVVRLLRTGRYLLHVQGKRALIHDPAAGDITMIAAFRDPATAEATNRCATITKRFRTAGRRNSVRL